MGMVGIGCELSRLGNECAGEDYLLHAVVVVVGDQPLLSGDKIESRESQLGKVARWKTRLPLQVVSIAILLKHRSSWLKVKHREAGNEGP